MAAPGPPFDLSGDHEQSVVANRYRIERVLGKGGFAEVYLARHAEIESLEVAIKVLHPAHQRTHDILSRFKREARLLAMLRNRHTVRLIDFGSTPQGTAYLVMEYVRGQSLDRVLRREGKLRATDAARLGIHVLKALCEAHSIGIVHRDLKPANILMVNEPGEHHALARVLDFGIAKVMGVSEADVGGTGADPGHDGTGHDLVFCTPLYAAPELLRGYPDFRTDLYALGLILAEMIDGKPPYAERDHTIARSPHLGRDAVPLGEETAASPLADLIRRAVQKEAGLRYQTAVDMLADLEIVYRRMESAEPLESPLQIVHEVPRTVSGAQDALSHEEREQRLARSQLVPASALEMEPVERDGLPETHVWVAPTRLTPPAGPAKQAFNAGEVIELLPLDDAGLTVVEPRAAHVTPPPVPAAARRPRTRRRIALGLAAAAFVALATAATIALPRGVATSGEVTAPDRPRLTGSAASPVLTVEAIPWSADDEVAAQHPKAEAVSRAAAHVRRALGRAPTGRLHVAADLAAAVRVNGRDVGALRREEDGRFVADEIADPGTRPLVVELIADGVAFRREISAEGPVSMTAALVELREQQRATARRSARRTGERRAEPRRDVAAASAPAGPAIEAPPAVEPPAEPERTPSLSLGAPIAPRTQ